jgi:vancomycin permeability regulator SanA
MNKVFLKNSFKKAAYLLTIWLVIHCIAISYDGLHDDFPKQADCALILGNKVNEDGTLSLRLAARCEKGLSLYKKGVTNRLIVSGGFGKEGFWEGTKMRDFLVVKGVPDSAILIDNHGDNTYLTAKNYDSLATAHQFKSVIIVSQFSHLTRTRFIMRKFGAKNTFCAHATYYNIKDVYYLFREFFAFYSYFLFS